VFDDQSIFLQAGQWLTTPLYAAIVPSLGHLTA
jgi:hypothetical protein